MGRRVLRCLVLAVAAVVLAGCADGGRASDPPAAAVRDAHSSLASLVLSLHLLESGSGTSQVAQVSLEQCLDDVAAARTDVLTAIDAEPSRRNRAAAALATAADTLLALGGRGAGELGTGDVAALERADAELVAAEQELGS